MSPNRKIKIFKYIDHLDCFVIDPRYKSIAGQLGLNEWHEAVWIGRYFLLDNDFGEHWFDNWKERGEVEKKAKELGFAPHELMIINPEKFQNGQDGPCHTAEERRMFWRDVLDSLELSFKTIVSEAVRANYKREMTDPDFINDLDERIHKLKEGHELKEDHE